jgi:hypothetical protein
MNLLAGTNMVDLVVIIAANLINLIMVGIFLSRPFEQTRLEYVLGWINIGLALPLSFAVVKNFMDRREWWTFVLPSIMIIFLIVELVLDYILQLNFRSTWMLWPYLILFYFAQWMLIGYAFLVDNTYGFITLFTYFLSLGATAYSYSRVGHGRD